MKKKKQFIYHPDEKYFEIDGKSYFEKTKIFKKIDGVEHLSKIVFEEVDLKKEKERLNKIKKKLFSKISKDRIVEEIIKDLNLKTLEKVERLLDNKDTKIKPQDGCLGLKLDAGKRNNVYLQLYE